MQSNHAIFFLFPPKEWFPLAVDLSWAQFITPSQTQGHPRQHWKAITVDIAQSGATTLLLKQEMASPPPPQLLLYDIRHPLWKNKMAACLIM